MNERDRVYDNDYGSGWDGGYRDPYRGGPQLGNYRGGRDIGGYGGRASVQDRPSHRGKGPKNYRRSDDRIREAVSERLEDDDIVDASDMEVLVEDGVVTLRGTVATRWMKRRAEDVAIVTGGVVDVRNELTLAR